MRPTRDDFWFRLAADYATRATCPRASVGAVLVKFDRLIGAGFNGAPEREEHCPDTPEHLALDHCTRARHAEINALRNALLPPFGATVYVVGERRICPDCTDALRAAGVERFLWVPAVPSLESVLAEVHAWQRATFPSRTPASIAAHLLEEAGELHREPGSAEEMADVLMLLSGLARDAGVDLSATVAEKLARNRQRDWTSPPNAQGYVKAGRAS